MGSKATEGHVPDGIHIIGSDDNLNLPYYNNGYLHLEYWDKGLDQLPLTSIFNALDGFGCPPEVVELRHNHLGRAGYINYLFDKENLPTGNKVDEAMKFVRNFHVRAEIKKGLETIWEKTF
jgi:hypothetical protein